MDRFTDTGNKVANPDKSLTFSDLCSSADDISYVRKLSARIQSADANQDGVTSKAEVDHALKNSTDQCAQKDLKTISENFDQLTKLATASQVGPRSESSPINKQIHDGLKDPIPEGSGISEKDLAVADLVADDYKLAQFLEGLSQKEYGYRDEPYVRATGGAVFGLTIGGFLTWVAPPAGLLALGGAGLFVYNCHREAQRRASQPSVMPDVSNHLLTRQTQINGWRKGQ